MTLQSSFAVAPHDGGAGAVAASSTTGLLSPVLGTVETPPTPHPVSPLTSIARGALALFSTQPLTWTASLAMTALLPRFLGDTGLGTYALALSFTTIVSQIGSLGVPDYLVRRIATDPTRARSEGASALVLLTGLALVLVGALAVALPFFHVSSSNNTVLRIALAGVGVAAAQSVIIALLRGQERHARFAWLTASAAVLNAAVGLTVLAAGGSLAMFMTTTVAINSVMFVVGWRFSGFRFDRTAINVRVWRQLAVGGLPFLGMLLATRVYAEVDALLLAALSREAVIGWYSAAYRIISVPMFIPTLVITPLLPALSRAASDPAGFRHALRRSLTAVLVLSVPACAMIIALAPAIPGVFGWPESFQNSVPLMMILALHTPLVAVDMVLASGLFALHRERRWMRVAIAAAVFNPALNLVLIPMFERTLHNGAIGAAVVTVATELLMLGGALVLMPKGMLGRETALMSLRVILSGVCIWLVTAALSVVSLPLAIGAGGATFVVMTILLQVVRLSEIRSIYHMGRAMLARKNIGA